MAAIVKKKAFEVEIPLLKQSVEALAPNQDALIGRIIKLDMTRSLRGKNLEANLIIKKEEDKLIGEFVSVKLLPSYISKMIRKGISYVEDSFVAPTKDGGILIKPYLMTRKKVYRSVRKALRDKAKEIILEFAKSKSSKEVFFSILFGGMQKELSTGLKKIYPLALCEIRIAKLK